MTSNRKISANRANAKKSTGPRTSRGKALARFNALKSGIHAATTLLPSEDAKAYENLAICTFDDCEPVGIFEVFVANSIAREMWKLVRLAKAEFAALRRLEITLELAEGAGGASRVDQDDLDTALTRALLGEAYLEYDSYSEEEQPSEDEDEQARANSVEEFTPPIEATFLKGYGFGPDNQDCSEIDKRIRTTTRDVLRLRAELASMQDRRRTLHVQVIEREESVGS